MEGSEEHCSLKWSNFRSSLTEGFHDLLREETMVDVTLAVEGKFLQAHKLVLSVCSPYFKHLFQVNPCKHPIVILRDVNPLELGYMLEFMYKGEVGVKHEELPSFLKLAETLKVKGLAGGNFTERYSKLSPTKVRKKKADSVESDTSDSDTSAEPPKQKDMRSLRKRKQRTVKQAENNKTQTSPTKRLKRRKLEEAVDCEAEVGVARAEEEADDEDDNPLVRLIISNTFAKTTKPDLPDQPDETNNDSLDNGFDDDEDEDQGQESLDDEEFQLPPMMFNPEGACDADQEPQGGVDYQMIQTKRGRDMLLYDGFTFTQNRMCKDGMRWQCSYPKCKAFCRMSSAGWLTPYKTNHEHERPSEDDIKRRILRMELKARAQSSGATPGEILRNALPADEYQSTDQRACYTRCIQRFRKSLQRKTRKPPDESWSNTDHNVPLPGVKSNMPNHPTDEGWLPHPKPLLPMSMPLKEEKIAMDEWQGHRETLPVTEDEKHRQMMEQKDSMLPKVGPYGM